MAHSIGKTIAELRKAKGWTQIELAEKLNVSDKAVSKWESEGGFPEITQLPVLAKIFDVSIDYLMTGVKPDNVNLEDMDATKRLTYIIEKDDIDNFKKYNSNVISLSNVSRTTRIDNINLSMWKEIVEKKAHKIFNYCCDEILNKKIDSHLLILHLYGIINEFIKMVVDVDRQDILEFINFNLFTVGYGFPKYRIPENIHHYNRNIHLAGYNSKTITIYDYKLTINENAECYAIHKETLEYFFANKNSSSKCFDYLMSLEFKTGKTHYCATNIPRYIDEYLVEYKMFDGLRDRINFYTEALNSPEINKYTKTAGYTFASGFIQKLVINYDRGTSRLFNEYKVNYFGDAIVKKLLLVKQVELAKELISFDKKVSAKLQELGYEKLDIMTDFEIEKFLFLNSDISEGEKLKVKCMNCEGIISLSTLKDSIINLARVGIDKSDKVSCLDKLIKLVKKYVPSILFNAPITYYELLSSFLKENNYKALFKFAVDYGFTDLANELMRLNSDKIERIIEEKFLFTQAELQPYKEICEKIIAKRAQYSSKAPTPYYFSQLEESKRDMREKVLLKKCKQVAGAEFVEMYKKLLLQQMENMPLENLNTQNANLTYFKDEKTAFYNNWLNSLENEYEEITHAKAMAEAHQKVMSEITKEYLLDLLKQENKEVLVIKLCVKLESILRNKFHFDGEFNEMINSLHSIKVTCQEDDGWGYMVEKEVEKYSSEMFEDFYKLRMARNSIVHASIGNVEIEMNVLKRCINWIEAL